MKRKTAIILSLAMALSAAGCGSVGGAAENGAADKKAAAVNADENEVKSAESEGDRERDPDKETGFARDSAYRDANIAAKIGYNVFLEYLADKEC